MPLLKKMMVFVDGENLTMRYQSMRKKGFSPNNDLIHEPDVFVWHPRTIQTQFCELIRATYYTSVVGDEIQLNKMHRRIKESRYNLGPHSQNYPINGYLFPMVFKKPRKSTKTRSVDINITVDILKHTYQKTIEIVYLVGGDGDYLPIIKEVMDAGAQIYLAALSDGLHPSLPTAVDKFVDLDRIYFEKPK